MDEYEEIMRIQTRVMLAKANGDAADKKDEERLHELVRRLLSRHPGVGLRLLMESKNSSGRSQCVGQAAKTQGVR